MKQTAAQCNLDELLAEAERDGCALLVRDEVLRGVVRRRIDEGTLVRPFPGMVMRASLWNDLEQRPRVRWRYVQNAYRAAHENCSFCSFSAALAYGLWVPKRQLGKIHLAVPARSQSYRSEAILRHCCPESDLVEYEGVRLTSLYRTVLDCSLQGSFSDGLAIADSALRYMDLDHDQYKNYVKIATPGRPGAARARLVAACACGDAENAGESIVRARIIELGYACPTALQVEFADIVDGGVIRVDIYYRFDDGRELIIEVDGMGKYGEGSLASKATKKQLVYERQRESHLNALGIPVMRVLFSRVFEAGYLEGLLEAYGVPRRP